MDNETDDEGPKRHASDEGLDFMKRAKVYGEVSVCFDAQMSSHSSKFPRFLGDTMVPSMHCPKGGLG